MIWGCAFPSKEQKNLSLLEVGERVAWTVLPRDYVVMCSRYTEDEETGKRMHVRWPEVFKADKQTFFHIPPAETRIAKNLGALWHAGQRLWCVLADVVPVPADVVPVLADVVPVQRVF